MASQLGFVKLLWNRVGNASVLHYTSAKSTKITRSILVAERLAVVKACNVSSTLRTALNDIFGRVLPLILYIDSIYFYDRLVGTNSTTEKPCSLIFVCFVNGMG